MLVEMKGSAAHLPRKDLVSKPSTPFSVTKLLLDISILRILFLLVTPFKRFLAWQFSCGRSVWNAAAVFERSLLQAVGWLSAPPKSKALRHLLSSSLDIRRWHLVAGL